MCGRYVLEGPVSRYANYFRAKSLPGLWAEDASFYNLAPTLSIPVVRINRDGERVMLPHRWGLIPHWAKDSSMGAKLNNARVETVHEKPAFRTAFRRFRCLIPASGYYEWQAPLDKGGRKQPYYIVPSDVPFFAIAGICDHWRDPQTQDLILSVAMLTTTPSEPLSAIHDRMPVMVEADRWTAWLDPTVQEVSLLHSFIRSDAAVKAWRVGLGVSAVGAQRRDDSGLIQPLDVNAQ